MFEEANNYVKKLESGYEELERKKIKVREGDKVLLAMGFLGHGFTWKRWEGEVLKVSGESVKVRWRQDYDNKDEDREEWVARPIVVEVIEASI